MARKIIIDHVHLEDTMDDVDPPPPPDAKSTFKDVHDWLTAVCESAKPRMPIALYKIGVFESAKRRVLFMVGINKYSNPSYEKIDFTPANMYFFLPEKYNNDLTREQLEDKVAAELREFAMSSKFRESFLADSKSVVLQGTTNYVIWSK